MTFRLPSAAYGERWAALVDTADPQGLPDEAEHKAATTLVVAPRSLVVLSRPPLTAD
jgi:glycogen operon protein